jgi:hypothetical protein
MPRKPRNSRPQWWKGGILGERDSDPRSTPKPQPGHLVWLPTITSAATIPLKDPFERLRLSKLPAAKRAEFERRDKQVREEVVRMLGLPPDVPDRELEAALRREEWLNKQAGAKVRAGAKRGGRKVDPKRDHMMAQEFRKRRPQSKLSDTALMAKIGTEHGLRRSAAIEAIKRGRKIVR